MKKQSDIDVSKAVRTVLQGIIAAVAPQRVLLFGSGAADRCRPDSDLDFLIVVDEAHRIGPVTDRLNMLVRNRPMPCDFIVATPSVLRKHAGDANSIYTVAQTRGRELYVAG